MKKILYIVNRADVFSGGEKSLLELLSRLDRSRFEPVVLCPGSGGFAEAVKKLGIDVYTWAMPSAKTANIGNIRKKAGELNSIIKRFYPFAVHTNGSRAQFYASLAVKGTGSYLVWHVRESLKDFFLYDWFLASCSDRIICVSDSVKQKRFGLYPGIAQKARVIYNGVDSTKFTKDPAAGQKIRKELGIKEGQTLIGIVGPIQPRKGHHIVLKAIKLLSEEYPEVKLLIIGKNVYGWYDKKLKDMIKKMGIEDSVIFRPHTENIKETLSGLDIFILPSKSEGLSRGLLEAMSCELPVIVTDVPGNREVVFDKETGLVVPFKDAEKIAEAVKMYINDKSFSESMGQRARARVRELFSIEEHVKKVQFLYEDLKR